MSTLIPSLQKGPYTVHLLRDGDFRLDGGAMFGIIPKPLWSRTNPSDENNSIAMTMNLLLLRDGERTILVDSGIGDKFNEKMSKIYAIKREQCNLLSQLNELGISPQEITDVFLTHLHFDHAGGLTRLDKNQELEIVFPNARHWIQRRHYEWALEPSVKDRGSFLRENFVPIAEKGLFHFLEEGDPSPFPETQIFLANGHTPAMQTLLIQDEKPLWFAADLLPLSSQLHLPYIMGYDIEPLKTATEKTELIQRAYDEGWEIVFEHDPSVQIGTVERFKHRFQLGSTILGDSTTLDAIEKK